MSEFKLPDGREAEELRSGIEDLINEAEEDRVPTSDLQDLLDRVDARDSLAYLQQGDATEEKGLAALDKIQAHIDREAKLEDRLRRILIVRPGPDLFRCNECDNHWRSNTGDKEDEEHRDGCIFKTT